MSDYREHLLLPHLVKNKRKLVLDLGCGDISSERFLHKFIAENCKNVLGVEIDPARQKKLRDMKYPVICSDAETFTLTKFDRTQCKLIIAGDLIEHLNNIGTFLTTTKNNLGRNGTFIFNTPNPYSINQLIRGLFQRGYVQQFPEHTCCLPEDNLRELLTRHGFEITRLIYFSHEDETISSYFIRGFSRLFGYRFKENIYVECKVMK